MSRFRFALAVLLMVAAPLFIAPAQAQTEWVSALRSGGHVIVIRHGATFADQADTDPFNLVNIEKQRQLTDAGRAKAKEIGQAFRDMKIPVGEVVTSMFYRAVETGRLAFGEAKPTLDVTEGGVIVSPNVNNQRTAAMRKLAATVPAPGTNLVVVSHKPNIVDAFGKDWVDSREGESSIFRPDGHGGYTFVVRVQADEWKKLAEATR